MASKKVWATGDQVLAADLNTNFRFGGSGADGALSISSGTTTLSVASASYFEKNYTTVSITGTANLAFSSPNNTSGTVVALRSTGNFTCTTNSTHAIDVRLMGGGIGSAPSVAFSGATSFTGSPPSAATGGSTTGAGSDSVPFGGGSNPFVQAFSLGGHIVPAINPLSRFVLPGGNGAGGAGGWNAGNGGGGGGSGGAGGFGGGGLYIECGGAYNFTTGAIDASGQSGSNGGNGSGFYSGGSGGAAGAGGNILVIYGTLTADSGTYNVAGGVSGGSPGSGAFAVGSSGNGSAPSGTALRYINIFHS